MTPSRTPATLAPLPGTDGRYSIDPVGRVWSHLSESYLCRRDGAYRLVLGALRVRHLDRGEALHLASELHLVHAPSRREVVEEPLDLVAIPGFAGYALSADHARVWSRGKRAWLRSWKYDTVQLIDDDGASKTTTALRLARLLPGSTLGDGFRRGRLAAAPYPGAPVFRYLPTGMGHGRDAYAVSRCGVVWSYGSRRALTGGKHVLLPLVNEPRDRSGDSPRRRRWLNTLLLVVWGVERPGPAVGPKLCRDDVGEIREAVAFGEDDRAIARRHGVHRSAISRIRRGQAWAHVS